MCVFVRSRQQQFYVLFVQQAGSHNVRKKISHYGNTERGLNERVFGDAELGFKVFHVPCKS